MILDNLISNAIKYNKTDGNIYISYNSSDQILCVEDDGIGIEADKLPLLFNRFYRVDEARARKTGGTGLGLAIAQQIIQLHQGTISVTSQLGFGTQVLITLPKK